MNIKTKSVAFLALVGFSLVGSSAQAGVFDHLNLFKKKNAPKRPIVRPYNHPTYGFYPTRWRQFPGSEYPHDMSYGDPGGFYTGGFSGGGLPVGGFSTGGDVQGSGLPSGGSFSQPSTGSEYISPMPAPPETYEPPTSSLPLNTFQGGTETQRAVRQAVTPVLPLPTQTKPTSISPFGASSSRSATPGSVQARRTSYSVQVAPIYGQRTTPHLPQVRPQHLRK